MYTKAILALMQLNGVSRKTIINNIPISKKTEYSLAGLSEVIEEARNNKKRVKDYSEEELSKAINEAEKIQDNCSKLNIKILSFLDDEYPILLKLSSDPPAIIYYQGDLSYVNTMDAVAIIGTREPSAFGAKIAHKLGDSFAKRGFVDVSGLAIGCDTEGHKGCLNAGGKTIAVLAGGLDSIYPAVNKGLAKEIVEKGGALLSEYPPHSTVYRGAFVERDRIQAALSCGVMVIETREQGGTLHAVRYSEEYERLAACFRHTDKYKDIEQARGNKMLVNDGRAVYVGNDDELDDYCKKLKEIGKKLRKSSNDDSGGGSGFVQLSLLDDMT